MPNISDVLLFIETDQSIDLPLNDHYLTGELRSQNTSQLIKLLASLNYSIDDLITQDPAARFLRKNSNLSFLEQFVRGAEGRPGGQSWIMTRKNFIDS